MDRGREAERRLDDRHDVNLGERVAHLVDAGEVGEQILPDVGRSQGLRGHGRIVRLIVGKARVIEQSDGKSFLVDPFDEDILPDRVNPDRAIFGLPREARFPVGHMRRIGEAARHDRQPRHQIERSPLERTPEDDGAVSGLQGNAGAGENGLRGAAHDERAGGDDCDELSWNAGA